MSSTRQNVGNVNIPKSSRRKRMLAMTISLFMIVYTIYTVFDQSPTPPVVSRQMSVGNEVYASNEREMTEDTNSNESPEAKGNTKVKDKSGSKNNKGDDNLKKKSTTGEGEEAISGEEEKLEMQPEGDSTKKVVSTEETGIVQEETNNDPGPPSTDKETKNDEGSNEFTNEDKTPSSTCEGQTQCETCQKFAMELKNKARNETCSWDKGSCTLITFSDEIVSDDIQCGDHSGEEQASHHNENKDSSSFNEDEELSFPMGKSIVLVLGFCLLGFVLKKKVLDHFKSGNNGDYEASSNKGDFSSTSIPKNMFGSRSQNPEHVPLSSRECDDWDWDDGEMGDVELSANKSQENDDLEMALALSLSVPKKEPPIIASPIQNMAPTPALAENDSWDNDSGWEGDELDDASRTATTEPTNDRTVNFDNTKNNNASADMNWNTSHTTKSVSISASQQKFPQQSTLSENDIQTLLRETQASHVPFSSQITSLGPSAKPKKKIPPPPKKEEEDIFASMGFSSSFNKSSSATKSASPKSWNNPPNISSGQASNNFIPTMSTLAADEKSESGSLWDDDTDLDGLLDE